MGLLSAIQLQPFERVKEIFESMKNPSNSENRGYQALNLALELNRRHTASYLIQMNCRVNNKEDTSKRENTPLHHAVELGDCQIVSDLLSRKASILAVNHKGDTPLHLAFLRRHKKVTELILNSMFVDKFFDYVNIKNTQGLTHMHIACTVDNERLVQLFLKEGANIKDAVSKDSPYCSGYTAMHFAIENKCIKVTKIIEDAGIFMIGSTGRDSKGRTPNQLAFENLKDFQILFYHLSGQKQKHDMGFHDSCTQFHMACLGEHPEVVQDFISHGAAINAPLSSNANLCPEYTPLHCAVESNCKENVELLIKNGAKVMQENSYCMTPLHLALYNEDPREKDTIVDLLYAVIENKLDDNIDANGLSYMHVAVTRNDIASVKMFLKKDKRNVNRKVRYNLRNFAFFSPLHFAVRHRHLEMTELLIKNGADVNCNDDLYEGTPLHLACKAGHKHLIDLLLNNGARADITRDWDNKTVLHLLVESYVDHSEGRALVDTRGGLFAYIDNLSDKDRLLDCVEQLVKKKCNINAITRDNGDTALHLACNEFYNGASCVRELLKFGADINVENSEGKTPFRLALDDRYRENDSDYMMLYHHVQKLKALGYYVNPKNEVRYEEIKGKRFEYGYEQYWSPDGKNCFSDELLKRKHQQRLEEIVQMKKLKLDKKVSLYDFLHLETKLASIYVDQESLAKLFEDVKELKEKFPSYAYLIKLRYDQAVDYITLSKPLEKETCAGVLTRSRSGAKRSRKE